MASLVNVGEVVRLDITPNVIKQVVHVSQYDVGRILTFHVVSGQEYIIGGEGTTAKVVGTKPDKKGFEYDATRMTQAVDPTEYWVVETQEQMTCVEGDTQCELRLIKSGKNIGTVNFVLRVEGSALSDDVDISETVLPSYIDGAQRAAEAAAASAESAAGEAEAAAASAAAASESATAAAASAASIEGDVEAAAESAAASAASAAQSAASAATSQDAEAWAVGKRNGADVPSSDPTYNNNAKYYSEHAFSGTPEGYEALVSEVTENQNEGYLRKNLLSFDDYTGGTLNGVTITREDDGAIVFNGTATANLSYHILDDDGETFPAGNYYISVDSENISGYYGGVYAATNRNGTRLVTALQEGQVLIENQQIGDIWFYFTKPTDMVDAKLRIMVRPANISDSTYASYAPSARDVKDELGSLLEAERSGGYLGKNLLRPTGESKTANGVTITVNEDNSVTLNGTATSNGTFYFFLPERNGKRVKESIDASGGLKFHVGLSEGADITLFGTIQATERGASETIVYRATVNATDIPSGEGNYISDVFINTKKDVTYDNVTVYLMLTHTNVTDSTYVPYVPSNAELKDMDNAILGTIDDTIENNAGYLKTKNALNIFGGQYKGATTYRHNGVDYTLNADGSISTSGTMTGGASYITLLETSDGFTLPAGDWVLSGCPSGGGSSTFVLLVTVSGETYRDEGSGVEFTLNAAAAIQVQIAVTGTQSMDDKVFYPMIRKNGEDSTFAAYVPSNTALSASVATLEDKTTAIVKKEKVTGSPSEAIASNAYANIDIPYAEPSGYTAFAVTDARSNSQYGVLLGYNLISGNKVRLTVRNIGTGSITPTSEATIVFVKSDLIG